jgi:thiamine pyrophosphokinase
MIDTIIVSGGNIQRGFALDFLRKIIKENGRENLCIIAADKGLDFLLHTDIKADVAIGDFDSLSKEGNAYLEQPQQMEVLRLPPEKDDSDTQAAVRYAINHGRKKAVLLGATGSRLDHVLANLGLLTAAREDGMQIIIADAHNWILLVENGMVLEREKQFGKYVSFFPLGECVEGLTLKGFRYPLNNYRLRVEDAGLTVSNEIQEETAEIHFRKGTLLMVMSRDDSFS